MHEDFYDFLNAAEKVREPFPQDLIVHIIRQLKALESFSLTELPLVYIVDFRSRNLLFVSSSSQRLLGLDARCVEEAGLLGLLDRIHSEDLRVFSGQIFQDQLQYLQGVAWEDHNRYIFSSTCRVNHAESGYTRVTRSSVSLYSSPDGKPLIVMESIDFLPEYNDATLVLTIKQNEIPCSLVPVKIVDEKYYHMRVANILSNREVEVLRCMAEGMNSSEIAVKLHLSWLTIKKHRANILRKTNSKNGNEAIRFCISQKII